ncbi:MAG: hypothetical protein ACKVS8_04735 [Phycisphaerales bacterium]
MATARTTPIEYALGRNPIPRLCAAWQGAVVGLMLLFLNLVCVSTSAAQEHAWTQLVPVARFGQSMAFDGARGVALFFGGNPNGFVVNSVSRETWAWNGTSWAYRAGNGPSARYGHAMAYDPARAVTVLFGGTNNSTRNNET